MDSCFLLSFFGADVAFFAYARHAYAFDDSLHSPRGTIVTCLCPAFPIGCSYCCTATATNWRMRQRRMGKALLKASRLPNQQTIYMGLTWIQSVNQMLLLMNHEVGENSLPKDKKNWQLVPLRWVQSPQLATEQIWFLMIRHVCISLFSTALIVWDVCVHLLSCCLGCCFSFQRRSGRLILWNDGHTNPASRPSFWIGSPWS